jgi:catechol 2,3-dioxygenase-like lactoylglutathione lyase family enzyme
MTTGATRGTTMGAAGEETGRAPVAETGGEAREAPLLRARALDHANLHVRDADAALRFYTDVLGLTVESVDRDDAGRATFVVLDAGDQNVFLRRQPEYQVPAERSARGLNHICIEVEPMEPERLLEALRRRGVTLRSGIVNRRSRRGPTASIYVEDLDGHGVEIKQVLPS